EWLEPLQRAQDELPSALARLGELVQDNPAQTDRLHHLEPLVQRRLQALDALRSFGPAGTPDEATQSLLADGRAAMDTLRAELSAMRSAEEQLLSARITQVERIQAWTLLTVLGSLIVGLGG